MEQRTPLSAAKKILIAFAALTVLVAVIVSTLAWFGVKRYIALRAEHDAADSRLTADSDYDATSDVVDEDYRFRLRWPGPGTKLMRSKDAQKLSSDAVAAAFDDTGCYGVVITENVPGAELEPMADLIVRSMGVEQRADELRKAGTVAGKDAILYGLTGVVGGGKVRYEGAVFVHQDYVYQLVTWRPAATTRDCYAWFSSSFTLLDGPVTGRPMGATPDQQGVGWRIRGGSWRNAAYGLAIDPPPGFRVVVGEDLASMNKRALVGMSSGSPQAHVLVFVSPAQPKDDKRLDALLREFAETIDTEVTTETMPVSIDGRRVGLHRLQSRREPTFEFAGAVLIEGARRIELLGWYSANDREKARPRMLEALGAVRFLKETEAASLGEELRAAPDSQVLIRESAIVRGGVYRDFQFGVTITKPPGFWELSFDWTPLAGAAARITALEHGGGLVAFLEAESRDLDDPEAAQAELMVRLVAADRRSLTPQVREVSPMIPRGYRAAYDIRTLDGMWRYDVTTGSRDGRAVHVVTFGRKEEMLDSDEQVSALSSSLQFGVPGLDPVRLEGNTIRDFRLGFEMTAPGLEWVSSPLPTAYGMKEIVDAHMWTKRAEAISVVAVHAGGDADSERFIVGLMEQEVARRLGQGNPGIPRRAETTLAGRPARQLTWVGPTKVDLVLTSRFGTTYGVLLAQPLMGGTPLEVVKAGLKLLD